MEKEKNEKVYTCKLSPEIPVTKKYSILVFPGQFRRSPTLKIDPVPWATVMVVWFMSTSAAREEPVPLSYSSYHQKFPCAKSPLVKSNKIKFAIWKNNHTNHMHNIHHPSMS